MHAFRGLVVLLALAAIAPIVHARNTGPIEVRVHINGADVPQPLYTYAYGEDVRIDLALVQSIYPGFEFIRVIDTSSTLGDINRISLYKGTPSVSLPSDVRVLLGSILASSDFPPVFDTNLLPGCRNWGLPFSTGGPDTAFTAEGSVMDETRVVLAAGVSGDITGSVRCGQVYRLQAALGEIADDVLAIWPDNLGPNDGEDPTNGDPLDYTIQSIRAKQITGRIIAGDETGPPTDPPTNWNPLRCSIRSVVVGVGFDASSTGIQGDILAYGGHIAHIACRGHVGASDHRVNLHASVGPAARAMTRSGELDVKSRREWLGGLEADAGP